MKVFLTRFAVESAKHCDQMEKELLSLEKDGVSRQKFDSIFRIAHTIKGASRMLKLTPISEVAHRIEDVLEELRSEQRSLSQTVMDQLLLAVDGIREMIANVAEGKELPETLPPACEALKTWLAAERESDRMPPLTAAVFQGERMTEQEEASTESVQTTDFVQIRSDQLDELIQLMGELVSFQYRKKTQLDKMRELLQLSTASLSLLEGKGRALAQEGKDAVTAIQRQVRQVHDLLRDDMVVENLLTCDLQERTLKIRMLPISTLFGRINRGVRDFARANGKEVEFYGEGGDTELDRKIIEQLGDCLIHMIRNAIDHGIETSEERIRQGKNPRGQIRLTAFYDGGGVTLVIHDDGAGINLPEVKATALKKDLISEAAADTMTEMELLDLLFLPGFSTSPIITDISGRGVGMNVVKETIVETLKGSVRIQSVQGKGTSFFLKVPITLALSRMLIVATGKHRFALPSYSVQEVLTVAKDQIIEVINKRAVRVREQILPLEELQTLLDYPQPVPREGAEMVVVLLSSGPDRLGLIVDSVVSEADMVIKSLPESMEKWPLLAGFTVGGQDEVISVLSVAALLQQSRKSKNAQVGTVGGDVALQGKKILVVDDSGNTREIVKSILESYGYQVDLAEDGLEALEKTGRKLYDAVITDVEMPQLDGFSLTAHLRQDERYRQTPVIIVTSREKPEDKRRGIQVGANAYIVKGAFDQNNLIETLQNLIG
ncbi:hybrid sensor histidine kinase/response regulator [Azotosporobacter soli]|uniref:hybrid sensor histidine kinase/response regulator n=1 Tax=Azotosporobacter soli TaxID=3055040 RepID=UPI0031FEA0A3